MVGTISPEYREFRLTKENLDFCPCTLTLEGLPTAWHCMEGVGSFGPNPTCAATKHIPKRELRRIRSCITTVVTYLTRSGPAALPESFDSRKARLSSYYPALQHVRLRPLHRTPEYYQDTLHRCFTPVPYGNRILTEVRTKT